MFAPNGLSRKELLDLSNGFVRTLPDPIFTNYGSEGCVFESRRVQIKS